MSTQVEDYRAKAKEYVRLAVLTKSLREGRRYRKLAEMYWALALGEESHSVRPLKCKIWYLISRTVSEDDAHRGNNDVCSVGAFAVKPRAFGAPLCGIGA